MTRRSLVEIFSYALLAPEFSAIFTQWLEAAPSEQAHHSAAPPDPQFWRDYRPKFFSEQDFEALQAFTEILIPTDETPGAREAHCAHFIDFVLQAAGQYAPATQQRWRTAMARLREAGFHAASPPERAAIVRTISQAEQDRSKSHPAFAAYLLIKRENAFAFYTSRAGMIDALDYRGNSYNTSFPPCNHPQHHVV